MHQCLTFFSIKITVGVENQIVKQHTKYSVLHVLEVA